MVDEKLDQDARIALMSEYSSNKQSWAVVALTIIIAIFSLVQVREILHNVLFFYVGFAFLSSQVFYSALRYLHYAQASTYVTKSKALTEEEARKKEAIDHPYIHRLELGISDVVDKTKLGKSIRGVHGLDYWACITVLVTAFVTCLGPTVWKLP
jgi:hypothetical protein